MTDTVAIPAPTLTEWLEDVRAEGGPAPTPTVSDIEYLRGEALRLAVQLHAPKGTINPFTVLADADLFLAWLTKPEAK